MKRKSLNKKIIKYLYHIYPYATIIKGRDIFEKMFC